jgi:uncharacterized protein DUF4340
MTPKTVIKLGIVTTVAVIAAVAVVANQMAATQSVRMSEAVFDGLEDRLDTVAKISILTAKEEATVEKTATGWSVMENDGYPAARDDVRKLLIQLSQLQLVEAKTRKADLYSRIEVEDIEKKDSKSALLTLLDDKGETVAGVIVGKSKFDMAGGSGRGVYLRKPDDDQAWLAKGDLELIRSANGWLSKDVLDIDGKEISRITTITADGDILVFSRQGPDSGPLQLDGMAEGQKLKKDALNGLDEAFSGLRLTDVAVADKKELPADKTIEAEVVTFGGLVVNLSIADGEDGIWAKIEASAGAPTEGQAVDGKDPATRAEEINQRVSGWSFQVPDFKLRPLLKPRKDLLEG